MSRNPNDTASHYPMPCMYLGQYGWHTNKGITWLTFSSLASSLGYASSCENFIAMPDSIWLKIYKKSFWDKFNLDEYHSQAVADIVVAWAWGSGPAGSYRQLAKFLNNNYGANLPEQKSDYTSANVNRIKNLFNSITRKRKREEAIQEELIEHFRNFYYSLNQPYYINGWLNRLEQLDAFTKQSLPDKPIKWTTFILPVISAVFTLTTLIIREETKKLKAKTERIRNNS